MQRVAIENQSLNPKIFAFICNTFSVLQDYATSYCPQNGQMNNWCRLACCKSSLVTGIAFRYYLSKMQLQ